MDYRPTRINDFAMRTGSPNTDVAVGKEQIGSLSQVSHQERKEQFERLILGSTSVTRADSGQGELIAPLLGDVGDESLGDFLLSKTLSKIAIIEEDESELVGLHRLPLMGGEGQPTPGSHEVGDPLVEGPTTPVIKVDELSENSVEAGSISEPVPLSLLPEARGAINLLPIDGLPSPTASSEIVSGQMFSEIEQLLKGQVERLMVNVKQSPWDPTENMQIQLKNHTLPGTMLNLQMSSPGEWQIVASCQNPDVAEILRRALPQLQSRFRERRLGELQNAEVDVVISTTNHSISPQKRTSL